MRKYIHASLTALLFAALFVSAIFHSSKVIADSNVNLVVMPPKFTTVHSSDITWSDIQKDLFSTLEQQLIKIEGLSLLNRRNLKTAMSELQLAKAGVTSADDASKIGKMLMADWVLMSQVDTFEISHQQRKMALDNNIISQTRLQLTIDYRIVEVSNQKLLLSDRYSKVFDAKPVMLKPNQPVGTHVSINLANKAISHASQKIAENISVGLFGGFRQPSATTQKTTIHSPKPTAKPKPSVPTLSDDDW